MAKRHYGRIFFFRQSILPPTVYKISGQVTNSGSPQQNAIITLIDSDDDIILGTQLTDAGGNYSFDSGYPITPRHFYHVTAEYESGGIKYNAKSLPFLTPAEN